MQNDVQYTEIELVALLKQQNQSAFAFLYKNYSKTLFNITFQIVGKEEVCNDLLQQIFVNIWQNIQKYNSDKGRLFTWMAQIAKNASIDYLRSKANKQLGKNQPLENYVNNSELSINELNTIDHIGIKKFVDALKDEYKKVLTLSYYEGCTHEEIAENLQIPIGTVKTRIRASIIILREKMIDN